MMRLREGDTVNWGNFFLQFRALSFEFLGYVYLELVVVLFANFVALSVASL
jgi:hypothetical protein